MHKFAELGQDVINMYKAYTNYDAKWKTTTVSSKTFEVYDRYEIINMIGQGAQGTVVAVKDKEAKSEEKSKVAIKKVDKAFEYKIFVKRTLRELRMLRLLKHENIINIETILLPKSRQEFEDIYVITEIMDSDLSSMIKSGHPLTEDHSKYLLYQLLKGLKFIHSASIVHQDLKPRNLLINENCDLKIKGFRLARPLQKSMFREYVVARWYKAPELLLGSASNYTRAVDMWSVGCIFAEMLHRKPFLPGTDTKNQIELICEYIGVSDLEKLNNFSEECKDLINNFRKNNKNGKNFSELFSFANTQAIDLLKKLLRFNPEERITAVEALNHPYMADLHLEEDEPSRDPVEQIDFEYEEHELTTQQLKDVLYEEILLYNNKEFSEKHEQKRKEKKSLIAHILNNSNATKIDSSE